MHKLGDRLRHARTIRGFSQERLSEISGVKQGTISKIERGDQTKTTFYVELANALDVRIEWLQRNEGPMEKDRQVKESPPLYPSQPPEVAETLHALESFNARELDLILTMIKLIEELRAPHREEKRRAAYEPTIQPSPTKGRR